MQQQYNLANTLMLLILSVFYNMKIQWRIPLLFAGTVIMMVVMAKTGASLKTPATPKGIIDLEFAYSTTKANIVTNAWAWQPGKSTDNNSVARINTYIDFIFLIFYALFLFFTCDRIAWLTKSNTGERIANGAIWAGLLDVIENAGMLYTLSGHGSGIMAFITTCCALIKWLLVIAAAGYAVVGIIQLLRHKKIRLLFA